MAGPVAGLLSLGVGSTPASPPPTGFTFMWVSDADGLVYKMDDGGVVSAVGGGALPNPIPLPLLFAVPVPPPGQVSLYASTVDRKVYSLDSFGVTSGPFGAGGGATVGWGYGTAGPGALYVDPVAGNDGTAVFYDQSHPYQTINAALADAVDGDFIILAPGLHATTQFVFGSLLDITIIGAGREFTTIQFLGGTPIRPPRAMQTFRLMGCVVVGGTSALDFDNVGAGSATGYLTTCIIRDVALYGGASFAARFKDINGLVLDNVQLINGSFVIDTCTPLQGSTFNNIVGGGAIVTFEVGWDDDSASKPAAGRSTMTFRGLSVYKAAIGLNDQVDAWFEEDCVAGKIQAGLIGMSEAATTLAPNVHYHGAFRDAGGIASIDFGIGFGGGFPDTATVMDIDFSGCKLALQGAADGIRVAQDTAVNPNQIVKAEGIICDDLCGVIVTNMTLRISSSNQPGSYVWNGTALIRPRRHAGLSNIPAGAGAAACFFPGPWETAPKSITYVADAQAISPLSYNGISTTQFFVQFPGVSGGANFAYYIAEW